VVCTPPYQSVGALLTGRYRSQPVLSFQHHNGNDFDLGIDVHPRLGLIAAAQDSSCSTAIRLHNLWTGTLVKEIPVGIGARYRAAPRICCLKFEVDQGRSEVRSAVVVKLIQRVLDAYCLVLAAALFCNNGKTCNSAHNSLTNISRLLCGQTGEGA